MASLPPSPLPPPCECLHMCVHVCGGQRAMPMSSSITFRHFHFSICLGVLPESHANLTPGEARRGRWHSGSQSYRNCEPPGVGAVRAVHTLAPMHFSSPLAQFLRTISNGADGMFQSPSMAFVILFIGQNCRL